MSYISPSNKSASHVSQSKRLNQKAKEVDANENIVLMRKVHNRLCYKKESNGNKQKLFSQTKAKIGSFAAKHGILKAKSHLA